MGEETVRRFVFHYKHGGAGTIRGAQMKVRLGAGQGRETHIWVKMQPPEDYPEGSYLDVLDADDRITWLLKHPDMGVIASSLTGLDYLQQKLGRVDIAFIPQHHCNFERRQRKPRGIKAAGVVGGQGAIQCDVDRLRNLLWGMGIEFWWLQRPRGREEVADFYGCMDLQIVWRLADRPLKNPLKLVNAASFGIPTIAYPELAYKEFDGYYWTARTMETLVEQIDRLRLGYDAERLVEKAEEYHIDKIAGMYEGLL